MLDNLEDILKKHQQYLQDELDGERADLSRADLSDANLRDANLREANLREANLYRANLCGANLNEANLNEANLHGANLSRANLNEADLYRANLSQADLSRADLSDANLSQADLSRADLSRADLSQADLSDANLYRANLSDANLSRANLSRANLNEANLNEANLSGTKGLLNPVTWLHENFTSTDEGIIVWKALGNTTHRVPDHWITAPGEYLEEVVNPLPTCDCACGVNFATLEWIQNYYRSSVEAKSVQIWECLIEWMDLASVVVPYGTDGKARCGRLKLVRIVDVFEKEEPNDVG